MAFLVQVDNGTTVDANAYITTAFADAYHVDRGDEDWAGASTAEKQSAIILATDYLDFRYTYIGERHTQDQTTEWPRANIIDEARRIRDTEIVPKIKEATAILALKVIQGTALFPDEDFDSTGVVTERSEKVDVLAESVKYANSGGSNFGRTPSFPKIDRMLREFITENQGRVFRSS